MLWVVWNKSWWQYTIKQQLYSHLPSITKTIQVRWTRHVGHCWRSKGKLISDVLLWTPSHGQVKVERPARTYIQSQEKINHLIYMNNLKLFTKNEKELETLQRRVRIYSQDIEMEFGIEKCAMLIMKSGKRQMMEGIELPNQKKSESSEKRKFKVLGNIGSGHHQTYGNERKNKKEYLKRTRKLLKTKL